MNYFQAETRRHWANNFWGSWKDLEQRGPGNTRFWLKVKNVYPRFGKEETRKLQLLPQLRRKQVKIWRRGTLSWCRAVIRLGEVGKRGRSSAPWILSNPEFSIFCSWPNIPLQGRVVRGGWPGANKPTATHRACSLQCPRPMEVSQFLFLFGRK